MVNTPRPAVFLDRDGVLNEAVVRHGKPYPPTCVEEVRICQDAATSVARLKKAGFITVIVTNQPDVAKGQQTRAAVEAINAYVAAETGVDAIEVCWCLEGDDCDCYKPKSGMLLKSAQTMNLDLAASYMIGDRWRDVGAGINAGCRTILIERGYQEHNPFKPDAVVSGIAEAVAIVIDANPDREGADAG